jgi:hypothetical protein
MTDSLATRSDLEARVRAALPPCAGTAGTDAVVSAAMDFAACQCARAVVPVPRPPRRLAGSLRRLVFRRESA